MAKQHRPRPSTPDNSAPASGERLQKVLAAAGLGSRRECEELITTGRVEIDRKTVTELGTRVNPTNQEIRVDGEALRRPKRVYFAVNKPVGVVTTNHDPAGRPRVIDLVPTDERVFAVGRLDRSSEGLILVTNDGEFANRLTHPRYGVEKTYLVRVAGAPDQKQLARLKKGVHLAEGFAQAQAITVKSHHGQSTDLIIVLNEGRNREIRRILARLGHKVLALRRIAVGRIKLGDLSPGAWRKLSYEEVQGLLSAAKERRRESRKSAAPGRSARQESPRGNSTSPPRYQQKQQLLAEPLSLDDLLRDDLDEGPLEAGFSGESEPSLATEPRPPSSDDEFRGGIIGDDDFAVPPGRPSRPGPRSPQRRPAQSDRGARTFRDRGRASAGSDDTDRRHPGKKFAAKKFAGKKFAGKKHGGKRQFGAAESGRGTASEQGGQPRSRPKKKLARTHGHAVDNQRRGERRGGKAGKPFGKKSGNRKGRR